MNSFEISDGSGSDEEDEFSPHGVLDDQTIRRGLSNLGKTASGTQLAYLNLTAANFNLNDIGTIIKYEHLQKISFANNQLSDLTPLGNLPYLVELDVAHNQLESLLGFHAPLALRKLDCSFNLIRQFGDLSAHTYLTSLNLDNNKLKSIEGLNSCSRLYFLSLANNDIEIISGLDGLPIKYLNLANNKLEAFGDGLAGLERLQHLIVNNNRIQSLCGLQDHRLLTEVDVEANNVVDLWELRWVERLPMLRQLVLTGNPVQTIPDYRLSVLFYLQRLTELDRRRVEIEEKVEAVNTFAPSKEMTAARDHMMHVVYNFIQPAFVKDSTLPSAATPYPILVLVGPEGSGKRALAVKLTEDFPQFFGYGLPHTTRALHPFETNGRDYISLPEDQFRDNIKRGQFLCTYTHLSHWYGIQHGAIEDVAQKGLACIFHMELEGALSLRNCALEPRFILVLPATEAGLDARLRERAVLSEHDIAHCLDRLDEYNAFSTDNPGFFDYVIKTDDVLDAYRVLRSLVLNYLGLAPTPPNGSASRTSSESQQSGEKETNLGSAFAGRLATMRRSGHAVQPAPNGTVASPPQRDLSGGGGSGGDGYSRLESRAAESRGPIEEASLRRREEAAKEAIGTTTINATKQLPARFAGHSAPPLGRGAACAEAVRLNSAAPPDCSPDSNNTSYLTGRAESAASSSIASSAPRFDEDGGSNGGDATPKDDRMRRMLPEELVDRLSFLSGGGGSGSGTGSVPLAPRGSIPLSPAFEQDFAAYKQRQIAAGQQALASPPGGTPASLPGSVSRPTSRPGSENKKVLPPITTTPPLSPAC